MKKSEQSSPWLGRAPRAWQQEALDPCISALRSGCKSIVRAATGAGKSILQAEALASIVGDLKKNERIVVSAPRQALVEQLAETFRARLGQHAVGQYYQRAKCTRRPVILVCHASVGKATEALKKVGASVKYWIADEAHTTETDEVQCLAEVAPVRLGFTATPFRSSVSQTLSLFDDLVYEYDAFRAIRDGVIVPPKIVGAGDLSGDVSDVCVTMMKGMEGPGAVNALTIADAEAFSERMSDDGIKAVPFHCGLKQGVRDRRLRDLERGKIDCVVHVNMLAEGVDLPWLRWLCMRRRVRSRVRFVQEVGRVLRSWPGKSHGLVLDPNDLFGELELSYDAVLGEAPLEPEKPDPGEALLSLAQEVERATLANWRVAGSAITSYLRSLALQARIAGLVDAFTVDKSRWRLRPASVPQIERAKRIGRRLKTMNIDVPENHRKALRKAAVAVLSGQVSQRDASDYLDVITAISTAGKWAF